MHVYRQFRKTMAKISANILPSRFLSAIDFCDTSSEIMQSLIYKSKIVDHIATDILKSVEFYKAWDALGMCRWKSQLRDRHFGV